MQNSQGTGQELRRIVHINEEIKSVVSTALKINLMAMNAIFLAKRAGRSALGFGVLSNELRTFALDLQRQMTALREMTYGSVATVTTTVKQARLNNLLERTRADSNGATRAMVEHHMRTSHADAMAGSREQSGIVNRRLSQMIADTVQLVELGIVLARSAKIEAAYGGGFSASLMQVSSDFEQAIGHIQRSLENLSKQQIQESAA